MDFIGLLSTAAFALWAWIEENLSTGLAAGAGTLAGAYLAFHFERVYKERKELSANLLAGKKAQFALMAQISLLRNLKKNYLDARRTDPDRALMLTPLSVHAPAQLLDFNSFQFFFEDDGAELLSKLLVAEQRFISCLGTLEQRNQRHEQAQIEIAKTNGLAAPRHAILKDLTDALYAGVDDSIETHEKQIVALTQYLRQRFPKGKVQNVEYLY